MFDGRRPTAKSCPNFRSVNPSATLEPVKADSSCDRLQSLATSWRPARLQGPVLSCLHKSDETVKDLPTELLHERRAFQTDSEALDKPPALTAAGGASAAALVPKDETSS